MPDSSIAILILSHWALAGFWIFPCVHSRRASMAFNVAMVAVCGPIIWAVVLGFWAIRRITGKAVIRIP